MSYAKLLAENSALANALDLVGDKWTLLILSHCYASVCRFNDFEKTLGINRNILSARLEKLVNAGVLNKQLYQAKPARYEYIISEIGLDLKPTLIGLVRWSELHLVPGSPPSSIVHNACQTPVEIHLHCPACEIKVDNDNAETRPKAKSIPRSAQKL
jgi:DNA-binding HxlR family transcriptional regulator